MNKTKELALNMKIKFCRKTGSAYFIKKNNCNYLIPKSYKNMFEEEKEPIRNGELFFVTGIELLDKRNRQIKISAIRRCDGSLACFREEDIGYFVTI